MQFLASRHHLHELPDALCTRVCLTGRVNPEEDGVPVLPIERFEKLYLAIRPSPTNRVDRASAPVDARDASSAVLNTALRYE